MRPGILKTGTLPKKLENFSASSVAAQGEGKNVWLKSPRGRASSKVQEVGRTSPRPALLQIEGGVVEEQAHGASSKEVGELSAWQSGVGGEDNAQLILCDNAETHQLAAPHPPEVTMRRKSRRRATTFFKMPNSTSVFSERSCASSMMTAEYLKGYKRCICLSQQRHQVLRKRSWALSMMPAECLRAQRTPGSGSEQEAPCEQMSRLTHHFQPA